MQWALPAATHKGVGLLRRIGMCPGMSLGQACCTSGASRVTVGPSHAGARAALPRCKGALQCSCNRAALARAAKPSQALTGVLFPAGRRLADPRIGTPDVRWLAWSVMGGGQPSIALGWAAVTFCEACIECSAMSCSCLVPEVRGAQQQAPMPCPSVWPPACGAS